MTAIPESITAKKMNQDVFSQLYQSLNPQDSTMFDEWLKQDFFSPECSVNSSPEIATPFDQFLHSPPFSSKDDFGSCAFNDSPIDLDVSAILDSPQVYPTPALASAQTPATAAATTTTTTEMINLFADIGDNLPAALAALTAVATAPVSPVSVDTKQKKASSPAATSASTPVFSATPRPGKKRASSDDLLDEAALKRQKNTDAARRSRLRKVQKMETLEKRVAELEKMNASLLMRVAVLDSEKTNLKAKESSYEDRIKVLEGQLAEAQQLCRM